MRRSLSRSVAAVYARRADVAGLILQLVDLDACHDRQIVVSRPRGARPGYMPVNSVRRVPLPSKAPVAYRALGKAASYLNGGS